MGGDFEHKRDIKPMLYSGVRSGGGPLDAIAAPVLTAATAARVRLKRSQTVRALYSRGLSTARRSRR